MVIVLGLVLKLSVTAEAATNLMANPSGEVGTVTTATDWSMGQWGSLKPTFSIPTTDAQDGTRSLYISVSQYTSGDAKWYPDGTTVVPGSKYYFSDWYKSSVATSVDVEYQLSNGSFQYVWLGDPAASATWKQFSANFTAPANAVKVRVFHAINKKGWVQTDNYSLSTDTTSPTPQPTPTPTPTPTDPTPVPQPTPTLVPTPATGAFSRPLVSIEFDDGWASAYQYGLPLVESLGWKATNYIITETPGWEDYMTNAQIMDWNKRGDIGSHTVSHPSLPSLGKNKITNELKNSKAYLDSLLGEPTTLLATPYCESNNNVVTVAKTLYSSLRNCTEDVNTKANFYRYDVKSFIVLNTTTDAEIKALLDKAKATNGWLVLVWHEVAGDNKNDWSVSPATLQRQLNLVKSSGIDVVLTQQALNTSTQP